MRRLRSWRAGLLRDAGAGGVGRGGGGLDTISYVLMIEEVARVHAAMATALSVTNSAVQLPLLAFGNAEQKKQIFEAAGGGRNFGSVLL